MTTIVIRIVDHQWLQLPYPVNSSYPRENHSQVTLQGLRSDDTTALWRVVKHLTVSRDHAKSRGERDLLTGQLSPGFIIAHNIYFGIQKPV